MRIARLLFSVAAATGGLIAVVLCISALTLVIAASIRATTPPPQCCVRTGLTYDIVMWAYGGEGQLLGGRGQSAAEVRAAGMDADAIGRWVTRCVSTLLSNPEVHARIRAQFGENGDHYANDASNSLTQQSVLPIAGDIELLEESIFHSRVDYANDSANAYRTLQISTLGAILIGLITTVLVSLSSTEFGQANTTTSRGIRVVAIVFPALGTAVAAISAFYAPREDLARSAQALASVRQIHDQIASEIGPVACPTEDEAAKNGGDIADKLISWKKTLRDARALAEAAALAAVDPTRNSPVARPPDNHGSPEGGAPPK